MGWDGCMMNTPNKRFKCPTNMVNCVDSTGAGAAFVSALIYGLAKNFPLEATARLANWYASYNIQKLGPRSFLSTDETSNYLSTLTTYKASISNLPHLSNSIGIFNAKSTKSPSTSQDFARANQYTV